MGISIRKSVLGIREQLAYARQLFPDMVSSVRGGQLTIIGHFKPDVLSETYQVKTTYSVHNPPDVTVLDPVLKVRKGESRIPHMYDQKSLCLYLPNSGEWAPEKILALTILPLIPLWLFYYELWHATGEWLGGGVEPTARIPYRHLQIQESGE